MNKLDFTFKKIYPHENYIEFIDCYDRTWYLKHLQECCEDVDINDVCGDWNDILNEPVYYEETENEDPNADESGTWSFYKFRTRKGEVVVRFYGSSNGYYSETATFFNISKKGRTRYIFWDENGKIRYV